MDDELTGKHILLCFWSHFKQLTKNGTTNVSNKELNMIYVKICIVKIFRHQVGDLMLLKTEKG